MNFRAFLCRSCRWQYFLWFQLFIGVLALYPVFIVFFGVTGGAAFGLLIGVLCFRRPSAANLSLRRKAGVGFLVAGAAVFLVNLMSGIYIRAAGFRGNEFLSDIAYLWIPGYLCFAAIPFLFSVVPRRFRFAAILFAAAWGGILLIVEPFYWGEFPVDEKWSVPVAVQNNFPVPLRKGGEPPKRFLAVVGTELAIIPVDQLSSLSCNNTMGGRPQFVLADGETGALSIETSCSGDAVSIRLDSVFYPDAATFPDEFRIPAETIYPAFSPGRMKIASFDCYENSGSMAGPKFSLSWRAQILRRLPAPDKAGILDVCERIAITAVGDLHLDRVAGTASVSAVRVFLAAPLRVGSAGGIIWTAFRSPENPDVSICCRSGGVWSRPERLTKGAAWELPSRKNVAAGSRKLHFLWQDGRNNYLPFPISRFLFQARYNDDLWYRSFDADTTQWNREIKLSAGCKYVFDAAVAAEGNTVAAVWIGLKRGACRDEFFSCRLFYACSFDGGRNWRKPQIIPGKVSKAGALTLYLIDGTLHLFHDSQYRYRKLTASSRRLSGLIPNTFPGRMNHVF